MARQTNTAAMSIRGLWAQLLLDFVHHYSGELFLTQNCFATNYTGFTVKSVHFLKCRKLFQSIFEVAAWKLVRSHEVLVQFSEYPMPAKKLYWYLVSANEFLCNPQR